MTDETVNDETVVKDNVTNSSKETKTSNPKDDHIANLNQALRQEREQTKELKASMQSLQNTQLEEQGKFKELYEAQKTEFESMKTVVTDFETSLAESVEKAKAKLPEKALKLFPTGATVQQQMSWINEATEVFQPEKTTSDSRPSLFQQGLVNPPNNERVSISREEFTKLPAIEAMEHLEQITRKDPLTGQYLLDKS